MNAALLAQDALLIDCPTVADVVAGRHTVTTPDVMLLRRDADCWTALGPYPVKDIEWTRLPVGLRVFEGAP